MGINAAAIYSGGTWLKAADLNGQEAAVTIATVEEGVSQFDSKPQIIIGFQGAGKQLGLNATNASTIMGAYGNDTDGWIGKPVVLFSIKTQNPQGQIVDAIRIRIPQPSAPAAAAPATPAGNFQAPSAPAAAAPPADAFNDDIPF